MLSPSSTTEIDKEIEQARAQAIQNVAIVVQDIVSKSFQQADETSFFCYSALRMNINEELSKSCISFLLTKVENESAQLRSETERTSKQVGEFRKSSFEKFWDKIKIRQVKWTKPSLKIELTRNSTVQPSNRFKIKLSEMTRKNTKNAISKRSLIHYRFGLSMNFLKYLTQEGRYERYCNSNCKTTRWVGRRS